MDKNRIRVIVADDESITRMDLQESLTGLGYLVVGAVGDGESAVNLARELRPELVLSAVRIGGHLFQPVADAPGIFRSGQRWPTVGQSLVEIHDHGLQAVIATKTTTHDAGQAERDLQGGGKAVLKGVQGALGMLWQASLAFDGNGHAKAIQPQHPE